MIFHRIDKAVPAFAAALLLGTVAFAAAPARAADAPSPAATKADAQKPVDKAEARIKEMHAKLHITAAQDKQWEDFVQAERDSAQEMSALIEERDKNLQSMNAVDDFNSYRKIAETHADGLKKVVPAFKALYDSLSDDQKKTADTLFGNKTTKQAARG
jgi:protein CpxP